MVEDRRRCASGEKELVGGAGTVAIPSVAMPSWKQADVLIVSKGGGKSMA